MNTFLPYSDFKKSAYCLDNKRLGKQRVEIWQIYNTLKQGEYKECPDCGGWEALIKKCFKCKGIGQIKTPWYNHPAVKMWKNFEPILLWYGIIICREWRSRGFKDSLLKKFIDEFDYYDKLQTKYQSNFALPCFLGNEKFHRAMRSNLLRKNKKHYSKFGWNEPDNLPYYWPVKTKELNF